MDEFAIAAVFVFMFAYAMFFYVLGIFHERRRQEPNVTIPQFVQESGPPSRRRSS